jgi:hypothetical protein
VKLKAKDYVSMRKYVHPKALGRLKGFTGKGKPSSSDLDYLHGLLGQVQVYRKEPFKRSGGDVAFALYNNRSQMIQFRCRKEGSAFLIRDLEISRHTGGAASGQGTRTGGERGSGPAARRQ